MKKKVFSLALVVCCLAVFMASSTLAYFTKEDTATNVITTGKIDIDLVEMAIDPDTQQKVEFVNVSGIMPGREVSKIVTVKNINNAQPAFIRVKVTPEITLHEDNRDLQDTVDLDVFGVDFNTEDWEFGGDGYFYYKHILGTGKETKPLFTKVLFSKDMGNMYQNSTFTIDIYAEAVQSVNIKDADGNPVTKAVDVPEEIWPGYQGEV